MTDPTLVEIMAALADQIRDALADPSEPLIDGLQVYPMLEPNPTPPAIDVYPADPFQDAIAFGDANNGMRFTLRARVNTPDDAGAQELLLSLMDARAETSLALAVVADRTLSGKVGNLTLEEGPSNYGIFVDVGGEGAFLGCTWTAQVYP